jgi:hypothetical protein
MSLNWNAKDAENWDKIHDGAKESLIFHTMFLGINRITEENYKDFYKRYVQLNRANGWDEPHYLTPEDVHNAVGLHTNASTLTPAAWRKKLNESLDAWGAKQVLKAYEPEGETL